MPRPTAWLLALCLAACSGEPAGLGVVAANDTSGVPVNQTAAPEPPGILALSDSDPATHARDFFFIQADLYLAGASVEASGQLAEMMRAMGRSDLVGAAPNEDGSYGCPRPWVEPIDMIARAAARNQFVMIESERSAPAQIAFAAEIVGRLAAEGFSAYADDGLTLGPGGGAHPDVLLVTEGVVTRDTSYGRLMRSVKGNGMTLIDAGIWWTSSRELSQLTPAEQAAKRKAALARQVSLRLLTRDPKARVIIHTERSGDPAINEALKADLVERTGEKPLTISLTTCSPASADPAFVPQIGSGAAPGSSADLVFAIPAAPMKDGRQTAGLRLPEEAIEVPEALLSPYLPTLIEARRAGDPALAVPEDRLLLFPGERLPLLLQAGEYRIEAWTKEGPVAEPVDLGVT